MKTLFKFFIIKTKFLDRIPNVFPCKISFNTLELFACFFYLTYFRVLNKINRKQKIFIYNVVVFISYVFVQKEWSNFHNNYINFQ